MNYVLPRRHIKKGSKVIIYGLGKVGTDFIGQIEESNWCNIVGVMDREKCSNVYHNFKLEGYYDEQLKQVDFDYIIISILSQTIREEIFQMLVKMGVPEDKIIHTDIPRIAASVRSFAQWGEDALIYHLFTKIPNSKSYIDVGAHDPYHISNTALMYENGWNGINIEANPVLYKRFLEMRPDDINVCCGVGGESGTIPFYMIDETSGRNSFDKKMVDEFISQTSGFRVTKIVDIEIKTLKQILDKHINGIMPDYMSIDIEGMEFDVLNNFDMKTRGPKVITIEIQKNEEEIYALMDKAEYFLYIKIDMNHTFVKRQYYDEIYR